MKKQARTLIILGAVLVVCIGAYLGVSQYSKNQAQKTAEASKKTQIYSDGRGAPVNISYEADGKTLSFEQKDGKWCVAGNADFPLNQSNLTGLASALTGLTAVRTLDMPASLSIYGLDKPAYTVTASDSAGKSLKLLIGAQNGDNYYAMAEGGNKVYTIASTLVGDLKSDLMRLIVVDTIPSMSETTIDTIKLDSGVSSLTLNKHKNKDSTFTWFVVKGDTYTAADALVLPEGSEKTAKDYVSAAVNALTAARFSSCAAYRPSDADLKTYGFGGAQTTLTVDYTNTTGTGLDQKSTSGTTVLELGAPLSDGTGYYARIQGSQEINVLSTDAVKPLFDALGALGTAK